MSSVYQWKLYILHEIGFCYHHLNSDQMKMERMLVAEVTFFEISFGIDLLLKLSLISLEAYVNRLTPTSVITWGSTEPLLLYLKSHGR
jgi:hypothetical protein